LWIERFRETSIREEIEDKNAALKTLRYNLQRLNHERAAKDR